MTSGGSSGPGCCFPPSHQVCWDSSFLKDLRPKCSLRLGVPRDGYEKVAPKWVIVFLPFLLHTIFSPIFRVLLPDGSSFGIELPCVRQQPHQARRLTPKMSSQLNPWRGTKAFYVSGTRF